MYFLRGQELRGVDFPGVQDLAAQRHDGLVLAVARLLRRAAGGIAFDEKQLRVLGILHGAVGKLARQRRTGHDTLAHDRLRGLEPMLRVLDRELRDRIAGLGMLIQPQREVILHEAADERGALARR